MEIYAHEEGGAEELILCSGCGSSDLEPIDQEGGTGNPSWRLMSRLSAKCAECGEENHFSWSGRVRFRFDRQQQTV